MCNFAWIARLILVGKSTKRNKSYISLCSYFNLKYMKNYFAAFLFLSIVFSAASQNAPLIKPVENTNEKIMEVLKLLGARSYRFDLRDLSAEYMNFVFGR